MGETFILSLRNILHISYDVLAFKAATHAPYMICAREFLTEFIHMHREYPYLWKVKSKKYSYRGNKNLGYEHLTTKLKEIDPDANKEKLVKKINSLRSCFRK
jgi:hypothetical protein